MITVWCDLDGVIFDFLTPYNKIFGEWESPEKHENFRKAIYDYRIFENLELMPRAEYLLDTLTYYAMYRGVNVEFLTSLASAHSEDQQREVARQKMECFKKHNKYHSMNFKMNFTVHKGKKKLFANEKSLLIDDTEINVLEFIENGGYGILYGENTTVGYITSVIDYMLDKEHDAIY